VALADLPDYVPEAFIAIEDKRFYQHFGIDVWGLGAVAAAPPGARSSRAARSSARASASGG
ncbi:MAG TPA: transglycosylase domain-containing protein, partial [Devosia sp.]|nr:transglycosylase domain-containing protein [Devosia sp.]